MARPKKSATTARTEKVQVRVTAAERLAIAEQAQRSGLAVPEYARAVLLETAATQWRRARKSVLKADGKTLTKAEMKALAAIRSATPAGRRKSLLQPRQMDTAAYNELRRQGVNLNQIAHRMNALNLPPPPELVDVLARIRAIIAANVP